MGDDRLGRGDRVAALDGVDDGQVLGDHPLGPRGQLHHHLPGDRRQLGQLAQEAGDDLVGARARGWRRAAGRRPRSCPPGRRPRPPGADRPGDRACAAVCAGVARSAASAAAFASSASCISINCTTSWWWVDSQANAVSGSSGGGAASRTKVPRPGTTRSTPLVSRMRIASRSGVRLTPSKVMSSPLGRELGAGRELPLAHESEHLLHGAVGEALGLDLLEHLLHGGSPPVDRSSSLRRTIHRMHVARAAVTTSR